MRPHRVAGRLIGMMAGLAAYAAGALPCNCDADTPLVIPAQATLRGHTEAVFSVAFSPDGKTVASGSADKTLRLWDAAAAKCVKTWQAPDWVVCEAIKPARCSIG